MSFAINITPENKTLVGDKTKDLKIRSNAVLALEVVLTYSPEAKIQQSQNFESWQAKNIQFLKEPKQILELSKQADKMRTENQEREREERQRKKEQSKGFTR